MNYYYTSNGERLKKSVVDSRIRSAKKQKLFNQIEEFGYNFCEVCKKSSGVILDCSHDISVKKCQEERKTELAWSVENITIRCRLCHQKKDGLDLKFKNN